MTYGIRCLNRCSCSVNDTCHYVFGCINIQQSSTDEVSESTVKISTRTSASESTVKISTSTSAKPEAKDLALSQREIIVYSIGTGAFVFVILLCIVCQRRYSCKLVCVKFRRYHTAYRRNRNIPEISMPNIPLEEIEGTYEVIDESNMIHVDNVETIMESNSSISNTNERNFQTNSYLTPYQPSDKDLKTSHVTDNKTDLVGLSDGNNQTTSDLDSTSSTSDVQNNRSIYLNPYQPIVYSADIHEYSSIHDSGSSGSETFFSLR
ncbi:unnamed protein product [Mytilus edulis]|uniref:Uncharacterized protein n=1 Tax=Mytilus edulis TaxID=6550 RepID=A0A8S3VCV1_MYTED|nr:unnamed protein product [Mytilus edulis]